MWLYHRSGLTPKGLILYPDRPEALVLSDDGNVRIPVASEICRKKVKKQVQSRDELGAPRLQDVLDGYRELAVILRHCDAWGRGSVRTPAR